MIRSLMILLLTSILCISHACSEKDSETIEEPGVTKTIILEVKGMTCTGCENSIIENLTKVDGVLEVTADHKTGSARVIADSAKVNETEMIKVLSDIGYQASRKG